MLSYISSVKMLLKRLKNNPPLFPAGYNFVKTLGNRQMVGRLRNIINLLKTNKQFRAFHEHETDVLPEFYHRQYERLLGPYATLMSREERKPILVSHKKNGIVSIPKVEPIVNQ